MRLAVVVLVHPERRTVDLVYQDTGLRVAEANVLSSEVSSDTGEWNFPDVPKPSSEQSAPDLSTSGRQLVAVVDEIAGRPVVVGFLHPLMGQMAFTEQDRQVHKHPSGAYSTIAPDGSIETWHPSGAYVRIGTGAHESLAGICANQNWVEKSDASPPTITVHTAKFDMTVDPSGNLTMHGQGKADVTVDQDITVTSGKAMAFHAGTTLAFTSGQGTTMNASGNFSVSAPQINLN